jgi:hypothetical protein
MLRALRRLRDRVAKKLGRARDSDAPADRVDSRDAMAAGYGMGNIPPGYVKSYDEGRPRH